MTVKRYTAPMPTLATQSTALLTSPCTTAHTAPTLALSIPNGIQHALDALHDAGHAAFLVGACVRDALLGRAVQKFDITTSARPHELLALWPRAVATGIAHGTVMLPTKNGPVDVTSFRAGPSLEADLAQRDFTIDAIAYDPRSGTLHDPTAGLVDLREKRLRTVGAASERFQEDPLRMLRALRLLAELQFELSDGLEAKIALQHALLQGASRERIKREFLALLCAPGAAQALAILQRTKLQSLVCPDLAADAPALMDSLPTDLVLRLAACLRHTNAGSALNRMRVSREIAKRVSHLAAHHPIGHYGSNAGKKTNPRHDIEVRRLLKRTGVEDSSLLLQLREAEIQVCEKTNPTTAAELRSDLENLRNAIARVQAKGTLALRRADLALQGEDVMQILHCPSGPEIGRALGMLLECVLRDPECNTPERLREILLDWNATQVQRRAKKDNAR